MKKRAGLDILDSTSFRVRGAPRGLFVRLNSNGDDALNKTAREDIDDLQLIAS